MTLGMGGSAWRWGEEFYLVRSNGMSSWLWGKTCTKFSSWGAYNSLEGRRKVPAPSVPLHHRMRFASGKFSYSLKLSGLGSDSKVSWMTTLCLSCGGGISFSLMHEAQQVSYPAAYLAAFAHSLKKDSQETTSVCIKWARFKNFLGFFLIIVLRRDHKTHRVFQLSTGKNRGLLFFSLAYTSW